MQIGIVGLGRMGMNMAKRLLKGRHTVAANDRSSEPVKEAIRAGANGVYSLEELVEMLKPPRIIWLMLPAGRQVNETVERLKGLLQRGDVIVDGGNSFYKDSIRREKGLYPLGIHYMDVGVSGGIWGLEKGYCLMIGGHKNVYRQLLPLFKTLAPKDGYLYCGEIGAGHFIKMVHNGIEYALMSAYGEGFAIIKASPYGDKLDFAKVSHLWNHGSVIRSWLLELAEASFRKDRDLSSISGYVEDSGEGRWTIQQAIDTAVPTPVIAASLFQRFRSRETCSFADKVLATLRKEFGGHAVKSSGPALKHSKRQVKKTS